MAVLDSVNVKIARAKRHLEDVVQSVQSVIGSGGHEIVTEHDTEAGQYVSHLRRLNPIPDDLSAVVGDFLHNLRSALDHIADGLIRHAGLIPTRRTMFPILPARPAVGPFIQPSPGPGAEIMQIVESLQPYTTEDGAAHPLTFLDELNRIDKHRQLLFAVTAVDGASWGLDEGIPSPRVTVRIVPLKVGDVVARFSFDRDYADIDFDPQFDLVVRLDETAGFDPRISRHTIDGVLNSMLWNVEDWTLPKLAPFLT